MGKTPKEEGADTLQGTKAESSAATRHEGGCGCCGSDSSRPDG